MASASFEDENSLFNFVVRDGNGVKGLVDSGISKVPERYVQPPEEQIEGKRSSGWWHEQAAIDVSGLDGPDHEQVVEAMVKAAETVGFFQVVNHGVPVELLESLKAAAHRFFAQPPEKKAVHNGVFGGSGTFVKYGTSFSPEKEKVLEWKDYLSMVYNGDEDALQLWPNDCKEVALEYLKGCSEIVRRILKVLIGHLGEALDEARVDRLIGYRAVNMNFYPSCPNPELTVGVGRHSDMGTITVLLQDGIGGLFVKLEEDCDAGSRGQWIQIPPITGALVVNVGDVLEILSNGRYKSAEHRVQTTRAQARVSIPLFTNPHKSEMIGPLPQAVGRDGVAHYRAVKFEEYMHNFFGNPHHGKKSLDFARLTSP